MANLVTFTLNPAYSGTDADNFTIVGVHTNGSPANTTIATNVTLSALSAGVQYSLEETITGGTVCSTGVCTNCVDWFIDAPTPTVTPTSTPTSTAQPLYTYYLAGGVLAAQSGTTYCETPGYVMTLTVESTSSVVSTLLGSTILESGVPYVGLGSDYIYAVSDTQGDNTFVEGPTGFQYIRIDSSGVVTDSGVLICGGDGGGDGGIQ
jgi:hypothetical protein